MVEAGHHDDFRFSRPIDDGIGELADHQVSKAAFHRRERQWRTANSLNGDVYRAGKFKPKAYRAFFVPGHRIQQLLLGFRAKNQVHQC